MTAREDDLAAIAAQETELHFTRFDEDAAWRVGSRLRELAASRKLVLAIDIRRFGHPLFYASLAGSTPDNAEWIRRKSNLVARFHRSSYAVGLDMGASLLKNTDCQLRTLPRTAGRFRFACMVRASSDALPSRGSRSAPIMNWSLKRYVRNWARTTPG